MTNAKPKDGEGAEALLPCPHCGSEIVRLRQHEQWRSNMRGRPLFDAQCAGCYCETTLLYSAKAAIAAWNCRAPPATPVRGGGQGSSNASRAATRDHSLAATEAEPSAAEDALFAIRNQLGAAKASLQFNGRWINEAGYITDAALWIERSISAADEALAKPLPEAPQ